MKRGLVAGIGAAVLMAGCSGGSGTPPPKSADKDRNSPSRPAHSSTAALGTIPDDVHIVMTPGPYRTIAFDPGFTFRTAVTLGGGADTPDVANFSFKIYENANFAGFMFVRFTKVCDPDAPNRLTAAPGRLLACLRHNPNLRVTAKPQPVHIAGVTGQRLDVEVVGKLPSPAPCNGDPHPCVRLGITPAFPPASDGGLGATGEDGYSDRVWILDVHGTQVAVFWSDLTEHFAANVARGEDILRTVRFT